MSNEGKKVKVHYRGTLDDGTEFDSSYKRNEPLAFTCMAGQMIPGFDKAVKDMEVGETINVHLEPEDAYGPSDPDLIFDLPATPEDTKGYNAGDQIMLRDNWGRPHPAVIVAIKEDAVTVDVNPEMAGKALNFEITLLEAN